MMAVNRYKVLFDKGRTLGEFLEEIKSKNEHGSIFLGQSVYSPKILQYENDKIIFTGNNSEELSKRKLKRMTSIGDWGYMDYWIEFLEDEEND